MREGVREKILAELFVPAVEKKYEVRIPLDLRVHELSLLLSKMLEELEPGSYISDGTAVLCDRQSGSIYSGAVTPREIGWANGKQLLLF